MNSKKRSNPKLKMPAKGPNLNGQIRWLKDVIPNYVGEIHSFREIRVVQTPSSSICLICRGGKMLCGKLSCPILAKAQSMIKHAPFTSSEIVQGSTPPGVFVGRVGYPKVYIGPMVPPYFGDTEILDTPELWLGKTTNEIVDYRFSLIRGKTLASVFDAEAGGKLISTLQELAMGKRPADSEATFTRKPRNILLLSEDTQPFGPSAPLKSFKVSQIKVDRRIEDAFYDRDLKASEAVLDLYNEGVLVTRIQRAFSLGMFGLSKKRKLVPTRWSITAVDSIISQELIERIKQYDTIDEYRVYSFENLGNLFVAILMPERWKFEWIECWFPGTTWNPDQQAISPAIMGDWEPYWGRKTYPDIGGCYYACRLAVAEKMNQEKKQASALVLREIHPGYILPLGVWFTRESVRAAIQSEPKKFDDLQAALNYAMSRLTVPLKKWIENSALLRQAMFQKKISDFITAPQ